MLKTTLRFLVVALVAVALGFVIYHFSQPAGTASLGSGISSFGRISGDFGGEGGFREGGFNLTRGLFGITGNLILIAVVTLVVVSIQKAFAKQPRRATIR